MMEGGKADFIDVEEDEVEGVSLLTISMRRKMVLTISAFSTYLITCGVLGVPRLRMTFSGYGNRYPAPIGSLLFLLFIGLSLLYMSLTKQDGRRRGDRPRSGKEVDESKWSIGGETTCAPLKPERGMDVSAGTEGSKESRQGAPKTDSWNCAVCARNLWKPQRCRKCGLLLCHGHMAAKKHHCNAAGEPSDKATSKGKRRPFRILAISVIAVAAAIAMLFSLPRQVEEPRGIIVWMTSGEETTINLYNLTTGTSLQIASISGDAGPPKTDGHVVVWHEYKDGNSDIYMYDISSGKVTKVADNPANQSTPSVSNDIIVWTDDRNGNGDIYAYNITAGQEFRITSSPENEQLPSVSGDTIVWVFWRETTYGISMYNISIGQETEITLSSHIINSVGVDGNIVVWADWRRGNLDIYMYDISTHEEKAIKSDQSRQQRPSVSNGLVVWYETANITYDIYMYNAAKGTTRRITRKPTSEMRPSISGNVIVWQDNRNGNWDIYMYNLATRKETRITATPSDEQSPSVGIES